MSKYSLKRDATKTVVSLWAYYWHMKVHKGHNKVIIDHRPSLEEDSRSAFVYECVRASECVCVCPETSAQELMSKNKIKKTKHHTGTGGC